MTTPSMCRDCTGRRNALIEESEIAAEYHRGDEAKRLAALAREVRCEHGGAA